MKNEGRAFFKTGNFWLLVAGIAAGLGLILWGSAESGGGRDSKAVETEEVSVHSKALEAYEKELEGKIRGLLSGLEGVSDISVMVTFESGSEYVFAQDQNGEQKSYVVIDDGGDDKTVLLKEIYPRVRGIAVVCKGGSNAAVQERIIRLLCSLFDLPSNRVFVGG